MKIPFKEKAEIAGEALEKLHLGEPIPDDTLSTGIEILTSLVICLRELGPVFHLPYQALSRDLDTLKGFRQSRGSRRSLFVENQGRDDINRMRRIKR